MTTDPLWYKDAIIYELHVRSFFDSTNDGVGDLMGLVAKLDYLQGLGVDALWLLPFYPSPLRDDGYDIAKYEGIHPSYGSLRDFKVFMKEAHARGLRVVTELVINHTSDQHPWFQAARRAPKGSRKRDFYVWSDTKQKYEGVRTIFTDTETSNWTWNDEAKAYYWHRFFHHQPDLNYENPHVLRAVLRVMRFWLDLGVDGMRLDAIPYLIEREGTICENLPETHDVLKAIRRELDARYTNRFLLAEANQWPADVRPYFGDGDECHMAFHFPLMPRMYMALKQEDRHPITEILRQTPEIPEVCQWAIFLRNHDELTLEMVTDEERDYLYQAYAADPQMRINVGIRRRLAPLLENSRRRIELLHSLLFSLPGTPVIYYGDEIGMGDNIYLGDRNGVRTPMQWTGDRNAGFSKADPARLFAPVIMDPVYGYQAINVEAQERAPHSLLNWMKRMIALRRHHQVLSRGSLELLVPENRKVLAFVRRLDAESVLVVANLAPSVQPVEIDLARFQGQTPVEMLGLTEFPRIGERPYFLTLAPYGFYWFQLQLRPTSIAVQRPPHEAEAQAAPALLVGAAWETLLDGHIRMLIERDLLLPFLKSQRWFGAKARVPRSARFVDWTVVRRRPEPAFFTIVEVEYEPVVPGSAAAGLRERYFVPLSAASGAAADALTREARHLVLAGLTGARKGVLHDGSADETLASQWLSFIADQRALPMRLGRIRHAVTADFAELRGSDPLAPRRAGVEQSNTSIVYGERLILKIFRRVEPGPNPDLELSIHLTQHARFNRVPAVAGSVQYERPDEEPTDLGMLEARVGSQADGWQHAIGELGRYYDRLGTTGAPAELLAQVANGAGEARLIAAPPEVPPLVRETIGGYVETAATLGRRTAELHLALASSTADPALAQEPMTREDLAALAKELTAHARAALAALNDAAPRLTDEAAVRARDVLGARERLLERLAAVERLSIVTSKIRIHGDYHLGQVLWAEGDFYIIDFEGEPARPLAERRLKRSALKDVAGMLRSFNYAAWAALFAHTVNRPDDVARLAPWARFWQFWTAAAFIGAYVEKSGDAPFLPADRVQAADLLEALVIDKALYELHYELNSRPDWVRIPLWGILPLVRPVDR